MTFEDYYHVNKEARYDLEMYSEIMRESKKVTDFLRGITDPLCAVAKRIILPTPTYVNDFTTTILFLASTLNITLTNSNKIWNIAATSTMKGGKQKG